MNPMKHDYTMAGFRAEMRRRGVNGSADDHVAPRPTRVKHHGNTIGEVVPCGVHPLHSVKVRANGSRSGCPMCEMQIESLCRATSSPRKHAPRIVLDHPRIVGCTCGWRTPLGTTDSDDVYAEHYALATVSP